jgi:EKC/KEOPS complex subunit PCC1/LAGE3
MQVDAELSPLVRRSFCLASSPSGNAHQTDQSLAVEGGTRKEEGLTILRTTYEATTNRMLRVAVNGFMESLGVVLQVMEELDADVLES